MTDKLELTVRFVYREHGLREVKDRMSRELRSQLDEAGIGIASATFELTAMPSVRLSVVSASDSIYARGRR